MNGLERGHFGPRHEENRKKLLDLLLSRSFIRSTPERPLYANGGGPAPWMLDTLQVLLTPEGASLAAACLEPLLRTFQSKQLATYGNTAVPLLQSSLLRLGAGWRGLLVRKARKSHGKAKLVEGPIDLSQPVVLVDDTLATGESVFNAITALSEEGLDVEGVVCLVRYGAGGVSRVEERGVRVEAVLDLEDDLYPHVPEGADAGPLNPTKWDVWPKRAGQAPEGLSPPELARLAMQTYLRDGVMLEAPTRVTPMRDGRGGIYVSLRRSDALYDRLARDGYWNFPGEAVWPTPEGVVRAAVQTAQRFAEAGHDLDTLAQCSIATTTFGPLRASDVGELDASKYGIVARSKLRRRIMGGALPNMPGLRNTFQQFRHAHTRNAALYEGEPYTMYRHTVTKDVEGDGEWQPSGVPGARKERLAQADVLAVARRAFELVSRKARGGAAPTLVAVNQVYVSLYLDGALAGCAGTEVEGGDVEAALETLSAAVWRDERFQRSRKKGATISVGVSLLSDRFLTDVADAEFMSKPLLLGVQCLEVIQGEQRALLLPSVPLTHDLDALEYTEALVAKAGITEGDLNWARYECQSALATAKTATVLVKSLPPLKPAPFAATTKKLLGLATSYLAAHHQRRGELNGTYHPFLDTFDAGLDPVRLAFIAWQKARVGLERQARQDLSRLDGETSIPGLAFSLLTRLELGDTGKRSRAAALTLIEAIDAHGRFELGVDIDDANFDYAPGQALLALSAALDAGVVTDPWSVVPRALDWSLRRYRLNHSFGAGPWLMQALTAFGRHDDARELADETLRFQSKVDGAFLTGQQDDCPGCTSVVPLEGLAAVYRAKPTPKLRAALEHGLRFVDSLVYQDKDVPILPNPKRALGGVRQSEVSGQVRQDFVGHLVNLLLTLTQEA